MKKRLLALLAVPLLIVGCSKNNEDPAPSNGPRDYQVKYEVTATKYTAANIIYRDQTGTQVTEVGVTLPKTYTFTRNMKAADVVSLGAFPSGGDASYAVTATISLDGKVVSTVNGVGPAPQTVASYIIP
jgi:hypothetical protein